MLEKLSDYKWQIPKGSKQGQNVPGIVFASEKMMKHIENDNCLEQVANVACLPGVVTSSLAMPDIHWGYGFPIGGVAATDISAGGIISPGGVGYDINCGVMLLRSTLSREDLIDKIEDLTGSLYNFIPTGVGSKGSIRLDDKQLKRVVKIGAKWVVERGYGREEDLEFMEERGCLRENDPKLLSYKALKRGQPQLGTLGSGNHFIEIQVVEKVFNSLAADQFGLCEGMITVMIHSGSRGLGYQVCDDSIRNLRKGGSKFNFELPDKQLVCAPFSSALGEEYFYAMNCAANYAWANRLCLAHLVRGAFEKSFRKSAKHLSLEVVYDVAHNIAKIEEYEIEGKMKKLCVHRKGATRAFPEGEKSLPESYRKIGQPVLVPGDMGSCSYVLVGEKKAREETFSSVCHGAGRVMSRIEALRRFNLSELLADLKDKGVFVLSYGKRTLVEEAPDAYKDVEDVVDIVEKAGLASKVVRLKPLGVIKG